MYSIIELQTTNGQTSHLYQIAETQNEAMSKFHTILSFAAVSKVEIHSCIVIDEQGNYIAKESYMHSNVEENNEE